MVLWCCTDRGVHAILSLNSVSSYAKLVLYLLYAYVVSRFFTDVSSFSRNVSDILIPTHYSLIDDSPLVSPYRHHYLWTYENVQADNL
jgi:hypothetical protein